METGCGKGRVTGVLFDSHNHLQSSKFGKTPAELIAEMRAAGIAGCVAKATREDDWEAMAAHCLKAWEELFAAMNQAAAWPEKFLMHSFGGSIEVAERSHLSGTNRTCHSPSL